jgi:hypothetical protein
MGKQFETCMMGHFPPSPNEMPGYTYYSEDYLMGQ